MRVQVPPKKKVANQGYMHMAPFGRENQLVHTQKKKKAQRERESSWFWEPRCKLKGFKGMVELKDAIHFIWVQIGSLLEKYLDGELTSK
jgi:hypothetical protein